MPSSTICPECGHGWEFHKTGITPTPCWYPLAGYGLDGPERSDCGCRCVKGTDGVHVMVVAPAFDGPVLAVSCAGCEWDGALVQSDEQAAYHFDRHVHADR